MDYLKELNIKVGQYVKLKDGTITQIIKSNTGSNFAFDQNVDVELNSIIVMFQGKERALLEALKDNIVKIADTKEELEE